MGFFSWLESCCILCAIINIFYRLVLFVSADCVIFSWAVIAVSRALRCGAELAMPRLSIIHTVQLVCASILPCKSFHASLCKVFGGAEARWTVCGSAVSSLGICFSSVHGVKRCLVLRTVLASRGEPMLRNQSPSLGMAACIAGSCSDLDRAIT